MLVSSDNEAEYLKLVAGLPQAVRSTILNTSVKLTGQSGGTFTGSGAILYAKGNTTTIVTAKHCLYTLLDKEDPPDWDDQLVADFQSKVSIKYGANLAYNDDPGQTAAIATVTPVVQGGGAGSWLYDVMILTSTDQGLAAHAATNHIGPTGDDNVLTFLTTPGRYLKRDKGVSFLRTGYGNARDEAEDKKKTKLPTGTPGKNRSGRLHYIATEPSARETVTVYNQKSDKSGYFQFQDAIAVNATPRSSSAPGDSGGPLFYVLPGRTSLLYLLGVTSGSDMATAQQPCPGPGDGLVVNNIVTSLSYCYSEGLLAY